MASSRRCLLEPFSEMTEGNENLFRMSNADKYHCINGTEILSCKCPTTTCVPALPKLPSFQNLCEVTVHKDPRQGFPVVVIIFPVLVVSVLTVIFLWCRRRHRKRESKPMK
ncbi:hypothetical protein HOLleu_31250 [Holothuria leucospilota]|uniref:Uncharacterized protein n=1 Tax=Holothuria leucospilota TaxID=206669 RepID=A0A9Q1BH77_HOLLE|nr:hypothetical protein HOLleu_31250 [Holothuria leucospilota]